MKTNSVNTEVSKFFGELPEILRAAANHVEGLTPQEAGPETGREVGV